MRCWGDLIIFVNMINILKLSGVRKRSKEKQNKLLKTHLNKYI
jgi:hypothetical protein